MQNVFRIIMLTGIVSSFALSACSPLTITFGAAPSPAVIVVTATPAPTQPPPPTLTPLPVLPSATPTSAPIPTATPRAAPTNTPALPPPPPPPPQSTPSLPQLSVSDQGGGNMDLYVFGGQVGWQLVFRAVACAPNCNNRPDGRDVNSVYFVFFKRLADGRLRWVFEHTEMNAPYCSFGGSGACNWLDIRNLNTRWPGTQNIVENGDYVLRIEADGKNGASWNGSFNFRVQR